MMSNRSDAILITCEHGGRNVPARFRYLFSAYEALLNTHRGWDAGALTMAREMAAEFRSPLFASTTTRLLIDPNRSIGHPQLYSEITRTLPLAIRREIIDCHYRPHRERVEAHVDTAIAQGLRIVHIASHSFTSALDGEVRNADVGLLYDPARSGEVALAANWLHALRQLRPDLRLRRNYPYAGKSDGLISALRRRHPVQSYVGIELEVNQAHVLHGGRQWAQLRAAIIEALHIATG